MFTLKPGQKLSTDKATYRIVKAWESGRRGQTYLAEVVKRVAKAKGVKSVPPVGTLVVVKTVKIEEDRGMHSITHFMDLVDRKLNEEARALSKLEGLSCVAQCVDTGTFKLTLHKETIQPRFLIQQYIEGTVLAKALSSKDHKAFKGVRSAKEWFNLSILISEALLAVHQRGIVHNDIWHKNIMLMKHDQPVLIDFGEAVFRTVRELAFLDQPNRMDAWIAPEWKLTHMRPSRRADIFSLGGVLHWMACGQDPPMPNQDIDQAKLDIETEIRENNPVLLHENTLIGDIIARCRRYNRELRISDAEKLRHELVTYSGQRLTGTPVETVQRVARQTRSLAAGGKIFLERMADIFLRQTERRLEDMCNRVIDISGNHEDLVSGCVDALASLQEGDEYLTLSTLTFWKPTNIGVRGRFWSMNRFCAKRGVSIRRVFLLTEADRQDEHFLSIMRAQLELQNDLSKFDRDRLQTRFRFLSPDEFAKRVERGDHCGHWISEDQVMDLFPVYDALDRGELRSIRLIISDRAPKMARESFTKDFELATPLTSESLRNHI